MMPSVVGFVGETYSCFEGACYARPTSAAFLQDAFGVENVFVASSSKNVEKELTDASSVVDEKNFYAFPFYSSAKDFVVKSLFQKEFFREYVRLADLVISKHHGAIFWVRTPSVGSILFAFRVIKANQKLINHMCADITHTWKDTKYSMPEKIVGYGMSRLMRFLIRCICRNKNTLNLCTGDVLERFSSEVAVDRTKQFVDVMTKKPKLNNGGDASFAVKGGECLKLLFVGRIVRDKGIFDLLAVLERVSQDVKLTIIGDGPEFNKLDEDVRSKHLEAKVRLLGQLPHVLLPGEYRKADLVVVPSNNFYEGFPRVIMEAWANEIPVIVSKVGGVSAFVDHDNNGLIFDSGSLSELHELISRCASDRKLMQRLEDGALAMYEVSQQEYWIEKLKYWTKDMWGPKDATQG